MGIEFAFELSGDVKPLLSLFVKKATLGFDTYVQSISPLVIEQLYWIEMVISGPLEYWGNISSSRANITLNLLLQLDVCIVG